MNISELRNSIDGKAVGEEMYELMTELYPICRSITGEGVRQTLKILNRHVPLDIHEVPTGTPVFDWSVPKEWNIRDAFVKNSRGERVIDFRESNLHVLGYSTPVQRKMSLSALRSHLFTLSETPDWIPYRTSYYSENWGFCLSQNKLAAMQEGEYEILIDSSLENGFLTYGEFMIPGATQEEILFSCHVCHPSLSNDNLSGIALATFLAKNLSRVSGKYSYRFLFIPGTIGSLTWLSRNENQASRIKSGLVLACVGDSGKFTFKKSRRGNAEIDRAATHVLKTSGKPYEVLEFSPYGYDERQFCSPGFNLPVGCFMRSPYGRFPQYHTSADDMSFVHADSLEESFFVSLEILDVLENNDQYLNQNPKGEPQLGRRGLYDALGGSNDREIRQLAMLWVLNLSDGNHSLLDISERSGLPFAVIRDSADLLRKSGLLADLPMKSPAS